MSGTSLCYVNGELTPERAAGVSALDRGLLLGDGLFETMRAVGGRVRNWERHWKRLRNGADVIGLALPGSADDIYAAVEQTLRANGLHAAAVRLTVTRGSSAGRGLLPSTDGRPTLVVRATPFVPYPAHLYANGMRVIVSRTVRRNERSPLSRIKSLNYLDNVLARREAEAAGADEALLLNTQGRVACATTANIFIMANGRVVTPPEAAGPLPGTMRALVCAELAPDIDVEVQCREFGEEDVRAADEVFLTNTLMGVMPVRAIGAQTVGGCVPGPLTRALQTAYEKWLAAGG